MIDRIASSSGFSDASRSARIEATNFALSADDGSVVADYGRADVVLVGVSFAGGGNFCPGQGSAPRR